MNRIYIYMAEEQDWEKIERVDAINSQTGFLHETLSYTPIAKPVAAGDRLHMYPEPGKEHGLELYRSPSPWVVTRVVKYLQAEETDNSEDWREVYLCYCKYEPIQEQWERVPRLPEFNFGF